MFRDLLIRASFEIHRNKEQPLPINKMLRINEILIQCTISPETFEIITMVRKTKLKNVSGGPIKFVSDIYYLPTLRNLAKDVGI